MGSKNIFTLLPQCDRITSFWHKINKLVLVENEKKK